MANDDIVAVKPGKTVTIDIVSDVVCPWCFIGKRNLEAALAQLPDVQAQVHWRPYQLDPTIPQDGTDRKAYLAKKFGPRVSEIYGRVTAAGTEAGIDFAFDAIEKSPNTLDAHRLIRWAYAAGTQDAVVERLFERFFLEGADVGDRAELVKAAVACGMDGEIVARLLEEGADSDAIGAEIAQAQSLGVTGVPFFIIDQKFALSGAQPPEVLKAAISKALAQADSGS